MSYLSGLRRVREMVPHGNALAGPLWQQRHRAIVMLVALQGAGLIAFGMWVGLPWVHSLLEGGLVLALAAVAAAPFLSARAQSIVASLGLMTASAILVHFSGGYIEAHFHFFVMLGIIFLYEDWLPYALSVGYVAVHHGIMGTLDPVSVYNHPSALAHPWAWAGVHALFIMGLSAALVVAWNVIARARAAEAAAMQDARDARDQLHGHEKLAALGSLVSGLAHEVRTPLTIVSTNAHLLERTVEKELPPATLAFVQDLTSNIHASVDRMNDLVIQLRRFYRQSEEAISTQLDPIVREAADLYLSANKSPTRVRLDLDATPTARIHPRGMQQVVWNLLSNAIEAAGPSGEVVIRTTTEGGHPILIVQDNGVGMSPEVRARMFDPLFTTKSNGMGLGMSIVKRIVDLDGGDIDCETAPGKGTRMTVRFHPSAPDASALPADTRAAAGAAQPSRG